MCTFTKIRDVVGTARMLVVAGLLFCSGIAVAQVAAPNQSSKEQSSKEQSSKEQSSKQQSSSDASRKRASVTIIRDGEVVFSKSINRNEKWRSLDSAIDGGLADSIKIRIKEALDDVGKRVNISSTGNTMTIIINSDSNSEGDSGRTVMSFFTDDVRRMGERFSHELGNRVKSFSFNTRDFDRSMRDFGRQLQNSFRGMKLPPAPPRFPNNSTGEDLNNTREFQSERAKNLADEASNLARQSAILHKEAEAMRLESEAMKKRAEALRIESESSATDTTNANANRMPSEQSSKPAKKK
jgi:hypothetical protein